MKPKPHVKMDSNTRHITLRIPDHVMTALESDSARLGISINSMSNSVLKRWAGWDRHIQKLGAITVPKEVFSALVLDADRKNIDSLVDSILPFFQDAVILMKGKYDLKRCIETLEEYMRTTEIVSDHTVEGPVHIFTIRHGMGSYWSAFVKALMGRLFAEFVPDREVEYEMHANIISVRVLLGPDWDEHDY